MASEIGFSAAYAGQRKTMRGFTPLYLTVISTLCITCCLSQKIGVLYFYAVEGTEKCFSQEVRTNTPLSVSYTNHNNTGVECAVVLRDQQNRVVLNRRVTPEKSSGKIAYLVKADGTHYVCVYCSHSPWFGVYPHKWSLSVDMGDNVIDVAELTKAHQLNDIELMIRLVDRQIDAILAENEYQQRKETRYRLLYAKVNRRVITFALIETAVVILMTCFAVTHLTRYFHAQKLY